MGHGGTGRWVRLAFHALYPLFGCYWLLAVFFVRRVGVCLRALKSKEQVNQARVFLGPLNARGFDLTENFPHRIGQAQESAGDRRFPVDLSVTEAAKQALAGMRDSLKRLKPELEQVRDRLKDILIDAESSLDYVYFPDAGVISTVAVYADGGVIDSPAGRVTPPGNSIESGHDVAAAIEKATGCRTSWNEADRTFVMRSHHLTEQ